MVGGTDTQPQADSVAATFRPSTRPHLLTCSYSHHLLSCSYSHHPPCNRQVQAPYLAWVVCQLSHKCVGRRREVVIDAGLAQLRQARPGAKQGKEQGTG